MTNKHYVEERLLSLVQIKEEDLLQTKSYEWQKKWNIKEVNVPEKFDFRTQIGVVVKMQKDADLLSAIPEFTFMPLDDEWIKNKKIVSKAWDYRWLLDNTDKTISDVVQSATTYWTWVMYEGIKHIYKKTQVPYYNEDGTISFKEEDKLFYSGIRSERIPFQNFFINWTDIENATECIVVRYFDKDAYIAEKELDSSYKNISQLRESVRAYNLVTGTVGEPNSSEDANSHTITELCYYNSAKDQMIIVANWIEVRTSPIPYPHKQLPFALFIDNKADDRIYWIWEFELLTEEEKTKNELRTLYLRGIRYSIWLVLKDRNADMEADELMAGLGEVYETDNIDWVKQITFNVPVREIGEAETRIDNDIIAKSGIDFKSLSLDASETATRTESKSLSSKKRINKNIKDNAFSFYRRLAMLRMANIQFIHSQWNKQIPIEGGHIDAAGNFTSEEWYGSWIITSDLIKGDFLILPVVETMLWNNKVRMLEKAKEYTQLVWNIKNDDGTNVVKGTQMAKLLTDEFGYDFEKLTEKSEVFKWAEDALKQIDLEDSWTAGTPADPNYVPPEQRRQQTQVPTLSGTSLLPNLE